MNVFIGEKNFESFINFSKVVRQSMNTALRVKVPSVFLRVVLGEKNILERNCFLRFFFFFFQNIESLRNIPTCKFQSSIYTKMITFQTYVSTLIRILYIVFVNINREERKY